MDQMDFDIVKCIWNMYNEYISSQYIKDHIKFNDFFGGIFWFGEKYIRPFKYLCEINFKNDNVYNLMSIFIDNSIVIDEDDIRTLWENYKIRKIKYDQLILEKTFLRNKDIFSEPLLLDIILSGFMDMDIDTKFLVSNLGGSYNVSSIKN